MSDNMTIFLAVAISVASQGILAPVAVWMVVRHYRKRGGKESVRRNGSSNRRDYRRVRNA